MRALRAEELGGILWMIAMENFCADEQYDQIWILNDSVYSEDMGVGMERQQQREKKYLEALNKNIILAFSLYFFRHL